MSFASTANIQVQLADGTVIELGAAESSMEVARRISDEFAPTVVAVEVSGVIFDLSRRLGEMAEGNRLLSLRFLTEKDPESLGVLRRSAALVMARAVMRLYKGASLGNCSSSDDGFFYDFDIPEQVHQEDFSNINAEMKKLLRTGEAFERIEMEREEACQLFTDLSQNLKVQYLQTTLAEEPRVSCYRQGEFIDLSDGPLLPDAGKIKSITLTKIADSDWNDGTTHRPVRRFYGEASFEDER